MCVIDIIILFPGYTPSIYASRHGNLPVVQYLIENKANIDAKSNNGSYMLCVCVKVCVHL